MLPGCGVELGVFFHPHPLYNPCIPHIFSTATPLCALKLNLQWSGFARSTGAKDFGLFHFVLGMALGNATCGTANTHGGGNGPLVQLISAFDPEIHSS